MDGGGFNLSNINHGTIFNALENWAPKRLAYEWDNVGLQIGSTLTKTTKVMITLDVLESVVDEAIENDVNLLIAHHPLLFKSIKNIDVHSIKGKVIEKLIKHDITVYAAHTNLDIAKNGVNDLLCEALEIKATKHLLDVYKEKLFKLIVFVPKTHSDQVREALGNAGAGHIGNYSHCTFQSKGQGTFMPQEGTNPFIGRTKELEMVDEVKMETVVQENNVAKVLSAMKKAHPYEEVAYDLFPLECAGETFGLGRIGSLQETITLQAFSEKVKQTFHIDCLRIVGDLTKQLKKVAVVGGSGEKFLHQAKKMGADVYITGDMTFHHAQEALEMGLAIIDPGHYIEEIMKKATKLYLTNQFANLPVIVSNTNTNPFQFI
ncbi:Nif3-like dinuclear metal center hexameric protein [Pseudogracilibacillus auburnensis]|nr:Nif3-like dinuclear metal center hexameric protein [Pseudogracilibacillus auburnensis]